MTLSARGKTLRCGPGQRAPGNKGDAVSLGRVWLGSELRVASSSCLVTVN